MIEEFDIKTCKRNELVDINNKIKKIIKGSEVEEGVCLIYCPHTTAGITINEGDDPAVKDDILNKLNELVPESEEYKHHEGNSDAHIKSSIVGASESVIIKNNELVLGIWQKIFFAEFDGPRNRKVIVEIK